MKSKKTKRAKHKYIIGIDEAGRGPIAGPVTVGAVLLPREFNWRKFKGLKDSKKLTPKLREQWFSFVWDSEHIEYRVASVGQKVIDSRGISFAIRTALNRSIARFNVDPSECLVLLDGGLKASEKFMFQKTIIKGDEKECSIALASVMAKVTRDRKMVQLAERYPEYNLDSHKGYGTKLHYKKIKKHGVCDLHRRSYLNKS